MTRTRQEGEVSQVNAKQAICAMPIKNQHISRRGFSYVGIIKKKCKTFLTPFLNQNITFFIYKCFFLVWTYDSSFDRGVLQ